MNFLKAKKVKGFTLIELMIVVAIIGILAAVAIPKFADLLTKSRESAVKANLGAVRSASTIYYGDTEGGYPTNLFEGLCLTNKYMPSVSGNHSLGVFTIPSNNVSNIGHGYGNVSAASFVTENAANTPTMNDTSPLSYTELVGTIVVNCTHQDTKASSWNLH